MDTNPPQPYPNPPSGVQSFNQSDRSWTSAPDVEGVESSSRSNGRSSLDSTSDRPKVQELDAPDNAKTGRRLSKLLRKRKKKNNQNQADGSVTLRSDKDANGSQSTGSGDGNSGAPSVNGNASKNEGSIILIDDSEPERYV